MGVVEREREGKQSNKMDRLPLFLYQEWRVCKKIHDQCPSCWGVEQTMLMDVDRAVEWRPIKRVAPSVGVLDAVTGERVQ